MSRVAVPRTFPPLVAARLRTDPGQPLLTAYDDATGERTELSVTTYANWVSKTANLLTDELGLEAGDTMLIDLPAHWLVPVFLGAAWCAGVAVTRTPRVRHDLVVCGPETIAENAGSNQVVACSLLPFAVRFAEPLPSGVHDFGLLWPGQSDVFLGVDPPSPDTVAWVSEERPRTQSELLEAAAALNHTARRATTHRRAPRRAGTVCPPSWLRWCPAGPWCCCGTPQSATWSARREDERATAELRAGISRRAE